MKPQYIMHGWQLSYFSGKLRGYLRYKRLRFQDKEINAYDLLVRIPRKTGATVMPVLQTKDGEWLQDTSDIIEELEKRHPGLPVLPYTPKQLISSKLIEAWADEWWVPVAMHYSWAYPENIERFHREAGDALLPYAPRAARNVLASRIANTLQSFLPSVGVVPEKVKTIESWTTNMLDVLETHFEQHPYLFGKQPTIADFALIGPLFAHLNRDPVPKRELINPRPNLQAWISRVHNGKPSTGQLIGSDHIPETLKPVFESIFNEFMPMVSGINYELAEHIRERHIVRGGKVSRVLGEITFPMGQHSLSRRAMPYTLWMMQRIQQRGERFSDKDKSSLNQWLAEYGQAPLDEWSLGPKLKRRALSTSLA